MSEQEYIESNGTSYYKDTKPEVIKVIDSLIQSRQRVLIRWGDVKTGRDYFDEYDIHGYIGRSVGKYKVPILVYNRRSRGGSAILTDAILKIKTLDTKEILYQAPNYNYGNLELNQITSGEFLGKYQYEVCCDGKVHARFETLGQVRIWARKLDVRFSNCGEKFAETLRQAIS